MTNANDRTGLRLAEAHFQGVLRLRGHRISRSEGTDPAAWRCKNDGCAGGYCSCGSYTQMGIKGTFSCLLRRCPITNKNNDYQSLIDWNRKRPYRSIYKDSWFWRTLGAWAKLLPPKD